MLNVGEVEPYAFCRKKIYVVDLITFVKPEVASFLAGIGAIGYLPQNAISPTLLHLVLAMFFGSCSVYSFNHFKDKEEDLVNKKVLNYYAASGDGYWITFGCLLLGLFFSLLLPLTAFKLYLLWISGGIAYSLVRLKRFFLVKNVYTAVFMTLGLFVGSVSRAPSDNLPPIAPLIFLITISVSLIGDLRDYEGDRVSGVRTAPVVLGYARARRLVSLTLALSILLGLCSGQLEIRLPSTGILSTLFFLFKNDIRRTRMSLLISIVLMASLSIISRGVLYI